MLWYEVGYSFVCGCEGLAWLARHIARRSITSLVVDVAVGRGVGCELLCLAYGYCVLNLRLSTGAV